MEVKALEHRLLMLKHEAAAHQTALEAEVSVYARSMLMHAQWLIVKQEAPG